MKARNYEKVEKVYHHHYNCLFKNGNILILDTFYLI